MRVYLLAFLPFLVSGICPKEKWDGLRVTWDSDFKSSRAFASLPRTEQEALGQNFYKISECDESSQFRGRRYVKDDDYAVVLLYDVNGYIAGIQGGVAQDLPSGYPPSRLVPPFLADGGHYFMTAYFVDPSTICQGGRNASQFDLEGTGTSLYIQNGTDPEEDNLLIPMNEYDIPDTDWTTGMHYWYDLTESMDCDDFFPAFLLYNSGRLTAFGWAFGADLTSSRFEHPSLQAAAMFMQTVPKCLSKLGRLSTMHIYLTNNPAMNAC